MNLLFITRTYPPLVGGMQKFASDFYNTYQKSGDIDLLANPGGKRTLVFFVFRVLFYLIFHSRKYEIIHLFDAVISPLIPFIRIFSRAKVSVTVNGLDIVYARFGYQRIMPFFLKKADRVIAVSQYTLKQCENRGIPKDKIIVITNGINFDGFPIHTDLEKRGSLSQYNIPLDGKKILLTVGRLVKRKGHAWFLSNVMVNLPPDTIYLIAGTGPEAGILSELIIKLNLSKKVFLLGQVTDAEKNCLYQISDIFVMPNISVQNDQEGFGIVVLEAGRYGLPVIAANIEGINDAVIDRITGRLVKEKDVQGFIDAITLPQIDRSKVADIVASHFEWKHIIERYHEVFREMLAE
jgi:glycosyltransferase involved in cell wall biosynthesis